MILMACPDSLVDSNIQYIQSKELHDLPGVYRLHNGLIRKSDLPRCVRLCCLLTSPHAVCHLGAQHILAHLPVAKPKTKKIIEICRLVASLRCLLPEKLHLLAVRPTGLIQFRPQAAARIDTFAESLGHRDAGRRGYWKKQLPAN